MGSLFLIIFIVALYAICNYAIYYLIERGGAEIDYTDGSKIKGDLSHLKPYAYLFTIISWIVTTFIVYISIAKEFNL